MNHIHRMHRHAILAVLLFGVAGCASSSLPLRPGVGECETGDQSMVRDTLYFGRAPST
jgi:hypothetical protein